MVDYAFGFNTPADLCNAAAVVVGTVTGISGARWDTSSGRIPPTETAEQAIRGLLFAYNTLVVTNARVLRLNSQDGAVRMQRYVEVDTHVGTTGFSGIDLTPGVYVMAVIPGSVIPVTPGMQLINSAGTLPDPATGVVQAAFSLAAGGGTSFPTEVTAPSGHDAAGNPIVVPLTTIERALSACA